MTCERADRDSACCLQMPLQKAGTMLNCTTVMLAPLKGHLEHHMCVKHCDLGGQGWRVPCRCPPVLRLSLPHTWPL